MKIQQDILAWYDLHGRHSLPWKVKNIYKIWISEIMLQQTQVKTAIPYFKTFIKKYPSLKKLCEAKLNDILKLWSGLGYYQRAENIFKTAQIIKSKYNGIFPKKYNTLLQLPGIGRTTASAILTFAKIDNLPILDGNIKRLLSRMYGINSNILDKDIEKTLWKFSENLLPKEKASEFNQALMDIGSLICKKNNPVCNNCPLQKKCKAFKTNWFDIPKIKKKAPIKKQKIWAALIINKQKKVYMKKISWNMLWKGLYSSPIFSNKKTMDLWLKQKNIKGELYTKSWTFKHKLSHIDFAFDVKLFEVKSNKKLIVIDDNWYNLSNIEYGIPKFQEKILSLFKQ
ncbi:MAG: A/G-specific adenine glycosylase [Gammaproteobacteria bacterium]|nr:A/G-specific adenine glycosylase [Gammaproteobacteria bacterium]